MHEALRISRMCQEVIGLPPEYTVSASIELSIDNLEGHGEEDKARVRVESWGYYNQTVFEYTYDGSEEKSSSRLEIVRLVGTTDHTTEYSVAKGMVTQLRVVRGKGATDPPARREKTTRKATKYTNEAMARLAMIKMKEDLSLT